MANTFWLLNCNSYLKRKVHLVGLVGVFCLVQCCSTSSFTSKSQPSDNLPDWRMVWSDEFDVSSVSPPDEAKWSYDIGGEGWGNKELEYYTNSSENAYLDGKGSLVIKAIKLTPPLSLKCWYGPCQYTSARLITKGKFEQKFGRIEARIKIPRGQGMWSAFWMLGNNIDTVGWANCGEIDIMENIGREPSIVHGAIHGPGYSGADNIGAPFSLPNKAAFANDFHIYSTEWSENYIRFYVDGILYKTIVPQNLPPGTKWVYDHPFFLIVNLAIGGDWGGKPDHTSVFPQTMMIDYVRVYQHINP